MRGDMDTCSVHRNTVVVHTDWNCPLCEALEQLAEVQTEADKLRDEIRELMDRLEEKE